MSVPFLAAMDFYHEQAADLERHHGPLLPEPDELHDHALAREDRLADHFPNRALPSGMTPAHCTGAPPEPLGTLPPLESGRPGRPFLGA